jgi:PHD/YefM family antitoxin component YafN of YafNO toxin-antitoxin module
VSVAVASALPEVDFTSAKAGLSAVMDDVVHNHQPRVVQRHGREAMLLVRPDDLARWLDTFHLNIGLILSDGEVTAEARGLGVLGFGETVDEALDDLASELSAYAADFFARFGFYRETDRFSHAPMLLRFAATPPDKRLELIHQDIEAAAKKAREAQQEAITSPA